MALINCPKCGEKISDRAESCPFCGIMFVQKEGSKKVFCTECGVTFDDCLDACPNCGCPVNGQNNNSNIVDNVNETISRTGDCKEKKPKMSAKKKILLIVGGILIAFFIILLVTPSSPKNSSNSSSTSSSSQSKTNNTSSSNSTNSSNQSKTETSSSTKEIELSEDEWRAQASVLSYEEIARYPDKYIGEKITMSGKIIQVVEGGSSSTVHYRMAVNDDYDTVILIEASTNQTSSGGRILEDDYCTVYGTYYGLYSYESTMNATITVPCVIAAFMD